MDTTSVEGSIFKSLAQGSEGVAPTGYMGIAAPKHDGHHIVTIEATPAPIAAPGIEAMTKDKWESLRDQWHGERSKGHPGDQHSFYAAAGVPHSVHLGRGAYDNEFVPNVQIEAHGKTMKDKDDAADFIAGTEGLINLQQAVASLRHNPHEERPGVPTYVVQHPTGRALTHRELNDFHSDLNPNGEGDGFTETPDGKVWISKFDAAEGTPNHADWKSRVLGAASKGGLIASTGTNSGMYIENNWGDHKDSQYYHVLKNNPHSKRLRKLGDAAVTALVDKHLHGPVHKNLMKWATATGDDPTALQDRLLASRRALIDGIMGR